MSQAIFWASLGVMMIAICIGLVAGLVRGLKRSSVHVLFLIFSLLLAFFITKPIANAILGITLPLDGKSQTVSAYILSLLEESFQVSKMPTASAFIEKLPVAIVSPILFIVVALLTYLLVDIIYLIVARLCFGKKKVDFKTSKPYRWYGALVGAVEGFILVVVLFMPLTGLTKTYAEIASMSTVSAESGETTSLKPLSQLLDEFVPKEVDDVLDAYNSSALGKVAGMGGFSNIMFDGLSGFKINGEKVKLRPELVSLAQIYDEFVDVYQKFSDKEYDEIHVAKLESKLKSFLSSGLYRGVVADVAKEYVINMDVDESSEYAEILNGMKEKFAEQGFDAKTYFKHDILQIVDTADALFESKIISDYQNLENKDFIEILKLVEEKSDSITEVAHDVFTLNLVEDNFAHFVKYAADALTDSLSTETEHKIEFNPNIEDKKQMLDDLADAVTSFVELSDVVDISNLLSTDDVVGALYDIEDIDTAFDKLGTVFDDLRGLEIFITQQEGQEKNAFDDILKILGVELLGDEVTTADGQKQTLSTYTMFFNHIKTPVKNAKSLGINDLSDFDTVLDAILAEDENFLAETLMPFYELSVMDINKLVFEDVTSEIDKNLDQIDFSNVEKSYNGWKNELVLFGKILGVKDAQGKAYVKAIIDGDDMQDILKTVLKDDKLEEILNPIFTAASFKPLVADLFSEIDSLIKDVTNVDPKTNPELVVADRDVPSISDLLEIVLDDGLTLGDLQISKIGEILDVLRTNAYNDGHEKGIFDNIFANIIWFVTGDNINGATYTEADIPHEQSERMKAYFKPLLEEYGKELNGYYDIHFKTEMAQIESVIDLLDVMQTNGITEGLTLTKEGITDFVGKLQTSFAGRDETVLVNDLKNMNKILSNQGKTLVTYPEESQELQQALKVAINTAFNDKPDLNKELIDLLNLTNVQTLSI